MTAICFSDLHKSYKPGLLKKRVRALRGLSLQVPAGSVFGLVGPNGAGKSTSIRLLLGLARPDRGHIEVQGAALARADLRQLGYLPENPYLYDHLTLAELLQFAGRSCGLAAADTRRRGQALAERLGVAEALRRPLRTFSKGMRQRAGLCFALLHDPQLVVLDEPMSGLDPLGRKLVCDLIADLRQQGRTVFFCSHILSDTERLCDAIAILHQGRLVRHFGEADLVAFRAGQRLLEAEFVAAVMADAAMPQGEGA